MTVYWLACFSSVLLMWFVTHIKQKNGRAYPLLAALIAAAPLLFISAIRYNVGADYMSYYRYYIDIMNGGGQGRFESLYYSLNVFLASFNLDPEWLFFAVAAIFLIPTYFRIIKDSPYPGMSVFLLVGMTYYFYLLNGARQMMGAACLLLAAPFVANKQFIPFTGLILVATGFHMTSIIFFGLYFLVRLHFGVKLLTGTTVLIFLFSQVIGEMGNQILGSFGNYASYIDSAFASRGQGYVVLTMNILITIFCTIFYRKESGLYKVYYTMQIISLWASALTGTIVLIDRFRMVFGLADIILIPMAIQQMKNRWMRIGSATGIVFLYFIYATYTVVVQNSNTVLPYQTIFD